MSDHPHKPTDARDQVRAFLQAYQDRLTSTLEEVDGASHFVEDAWRREGLGGGRTRVMQGGGLFEQGGVNFSEIAGNALPPAVLKQHPHLAGQPFWAAGVSLVLHPENPYCPTVHLNYRYFEAGDVYWFAGGADLTPYYPVKADCVHWHRVLKAAMDRHDPLYYPAFSYWCDAYFYLPHRQETRGIGGVFYDYLDGTSGELVKANAIGASAEQDHPARALTQQAKTWDALWAFHQDQAGAFFDAYLPIVDAHRGAAYGERERQFQLYRRGRYVEFNLLYDRGTLFGLQSKGRTESILMSLPPLVRWEYDYRAPKGSDEEALTRDFLHRGMDWAAS